jgi:hypothetical protein
MPGSEFDVSPLFWLGGLAVCLGLHLYLHPQAKVFRQAVRWLGRHPAPVLWLAVTLGLSGWWAQATGGAGPGLPGQDSPLASIPHPNPVFAPWPETFVEALASGWHQLALLFHRVVAVPAFWPGHWAGAALQAGVSAFTQVWFACYVINTRNIFTEEGLSLRQTLVRWPNVLVLAACHWVWWWVQGQPSARWDLLQGLVLPEFFLFLGPLPLAIALLRGSFLKAGELTLKWWAEHWGKLALFALTGLPLLTLLHVGMGILPETGLRQWPIALAFLEGVLVATVHLWLFVSAALLLLWGGYGEEANAPVSPAKEA